MNLSVCSLGEIEYMSLKPAKRVELWKVVRNTNLSPTQSAFVAVSVSVDSNAKSDPPHQDVFRKSVD